jgi:hypothetical protein
MLVNTAKNYSKSLDDISKTKHRVIGLFNLFLGEIDPLLKLIFIQFLHEFSNG